MNQSESSDTEAGTAVASDGLPALVVGPWWQEKHHYIERYQDIFNVGMSGRWRTRFYVDLFSGPGRCILQDSRVEVPGSPVVAVTGRKPFSSYYFSDKSKVYIEALQKRLGSEVTQATFFSGDANEIIDSLVAVLPNPTESLGLAFLDPFGFNLKFDTIARLTKGRRIDLMITVHTGYLQRFAERSPHSYEDFFGRASWFTEYVEKRHTMRRIRALLDVYEEGLVRIGYERENIEDEILVERRGHPLYHIIFASKHPRGREFWRKISRKTFHGQQRLNLPFE